MKAFVIWGLAGCIFIGLGIQSFFAKKQIGFWANAELYEIPVEMSLPKIEFSLAYDKKTINKTALKFAECILKECNGTYYNK